MEEIKKHAITRLLKLEQIQNNMKTAICVNYKPTDTLSASGFMADLPHGCGLVSKWCLRGMITD